ncbi:MAG: hypothetical protein QXP31_07465 [Pyrobaculum sp.]
MDQVISTVSIIATIVASSASLGYWLTSKFKDVGLRFEALELRLKALEMRMANLEKGLFAYNEAMLRVLEAKGVLTATEALLLFRALKAVVPSATSKYYTKEVEKRLRELLDKNPEEYTMADVEELKKIADLMLDEYMVSRREELLEYQARLRVAAQIIKILFVEPKILRGEAVLKPGAAKKESQHA